MKVRFPSLSTTGIMEDDDSIINKLFMFFITSEFSQTFFYEDHVASLKYLISKYGKDEIIFKNMIETTLSVMYNRYYEDTEVVAEIHSDINKPGVLHLKIDIITFNEKKELTLSDTIGIENDKIIYFNNHLEDLYKNKGRL